MTRKVKPVPVRIVHDEPVRSEYKPPDSMHVSIRQIKNGFIVNRHGHKDGKHFDEEFFTPHQPEVGVAATPRQRPSPRTRERSVAPAKPATPQRAQTSNEKKLTGFMTVDMTPQPKKAMPKSPLNVPSDAGLPQLKRARNQRLSRLKL